MKTFLIVHFREIKKKSQWGKSVEFIIDEFRKKHAGLFVLVRNREEVSNELEQISNCEIITSRKTEKRSMEGEEFELIFLQTL